MRAAWPSSTTRRRRASSTPWRGPEYEASGSISRPAAQPTRRQGARGFGGARAELGPRQPGFAELLELVRSGRAYVKISGAYRSSSLGPDYADVVPLAQALIAANPERIVWGTDWPHPNSASGRNATEVTPLFQIDDGRLLNQLAVWAPDAATRSRILVDNPAHLYGF